MFKTHDLGDLMLLGLNPSSETDLQVFLGHGSVQVARDLTAGIPLSPGMYSHYIQFTVYLSHSKRDCFSCNVS